VTCDATARAWSVLWGRPGTTDRGGCAVVPGRGARRSCSGARRCRRSAYLQRQAFLTHICWSRVGATAAAVGMDGPHERATYATRNGGRVGSALEHKPSTSGGTKGGCGTCNRTARGRDEGEHPEQHHQCSRHPGKKVEFRFWFPLNSRRGGDPRFFFDCEVSSRRSFGEVSSYP
jgi:hypothetical protein